MCRNFWALLKKFGMLLVEVFNYKKKNCVSLQILTPPDIMAINFR